jgi:hypothetical protein
MSDDFEIVVMYPIDMNGPVVEININNKFVGQLSQEEGPAHKIFEIAGDGENGLGPLKFDLELFVRAFAAARKRFAELHDERDSSSGQN